METLELLIFFGESLATVLLLPKSAGGYTVLQLVSLDLSPRILGEAVTKNEALDLIQSHFQTINNIVCKRNY